MLWQFQVYSKWISHIYMYVYSFFRFFCHIGHCRVLSRVPCVVVQLLNCVQLFVTPWTAARQASLSFTVSWSLLKFMSIESMMLSNHLILCFSLLLLLLVFSSIRVFSNELALHVRWPKYWNFSFSISPYNEYSELISSRIDWLDLLAVQGTLARYLFTLQFSSVQSLSSVRLCNPMNRSTSGLPVHH